MNNEYIEFRKKGRGRDKRKRRRRRTRKIVGGALATSGIIAGTLAASRTEKGKSFIKSSKNKGLDIKNNLNTRVGRLSTGVKVHTKPDEMLRTVREKFTDNPVVKTIDVPAFNTTKRRKKKK